MAEGGIKGGPSYGETDDFGFGTAPDPFHVHDFHATVLNRLGVNRKRPTNVHGHIIITDDYFLTSQQGFFRWFSQKFFTPHSIPDRNRTCI